LLSQLHQRAPLAVASGVQFWNSQFLADEQAADPDIGCFLQIVDDDTLDWDLVKTTSPSVRALWRQRQSLFLHDGMLFRKFERSGGLPPLNQLILPRSLRMVFL
jgi:hypothetical protein